MSACSCPQWKANIDKINAPFQLQAIRSGGVGYDGKGFAYCPWCGSVLFDDRKQSPQPAVHRDPKTGARVDNPPEPPDQDPLF